MFGWKTGFRRTGAMAVAVSAALCLAGAPALADDQDDADQLMQRLDQQQTALNEANRNYLMASAEYDAAIASMEEAEKQVQRETARIRRLQQSLGNYAIQMYKHDEMDNMLGILLESVSLRQAVDTWEALRIIGERNADLVVEAKQARETLRIARDTLDEQRQNAAAQKALTKANQKEAAALQESMGSEVSRITAEIAALEAQSDLLEDAALEAEAQLAEAEEHARAELEARAQAARIAADAAKAATTNTQQEAEALGIDPNLPVSYTLLQNPCPTAWESSGFGFRSFDNSFHMGLDMAAASGTPYYAAESGTVLYATNDGGWNGGAGNWVVISHGNGLVTKYMHSSRTLVTPGQQVVRGQHIGDVGETGEAFGAHLHFQVEIDGQPVNPANYI